MMTIGHTVLYSPGELKIDYLLQDSFFIEGVNLCWLMCWADKEKEIMKPSLYPHLLLKPDQQKYSE